MALTNAGTTFRFTLNNASGVYLNTGKTLTVRHYYSGNSSSVRPLTMLNVLGQVFHRQTVDAPATPATVDLSKLTPGVYPLRVSNAEATLNERLVRE